MGLLSPTQFVYPIPYNPPCGEAANPSTNTLGMIEQGEQLTTSLFSDMIPPSAVLDQQG